MRARPPVPSAAACARSRPTGRVAINHRTRHRGSPLGSHGRHPGHQQHGACRAGCQRCAFRRPPMATNRALRAHRATAHLTSEGAREHACSLRVGPTCGATRSDLVARLLKPEIDNKEIHDGVMWFLWKWMGGLAAWLPAPPLTLSPCTPSPGQPSTWAACLILPSVSVCVLDGCVAARHRSTEQAH